MCGIPNKSVAEAGRAILLGRAASGRMRDALSLLDQAIAYGGEVHEEGVRYAGCGGSPLSVHLLAALATTTAWRR